MTRNSRLNSLSATKDKRLLFKVVKTNWTHNNRPFQRKRIAIVVKSKFGDQFALLNVDVKIDIKIIVQGRRKVLPEITHHARRQLKYNVQLDWSS